MTLREQIKELHKKRFGKEFHEHRKAMIPAMVKDLMEKQWEELEIRDLETDHTFIPYVTVWTVPDSIEIRATKKAWELINSIGLRECTPAEE